MGFQLGTVPVKYLGVHLISTKLSICDCNSLITINAKISRWAKKSLSYAGRLQLLRSVLFSTPIQVYWILHFILAYTVYFHIEK